MDLAPDFDEFVGSLIANEVEFLIVGDGRKTWLISMR
jgi:hypothetical protein